MKGIKMMILTSMICVFVGNLAMAQEEITDNDCKYMIDFDLEGFSGEEHDFERDSENKIITDAINLVFLNLF